MISKERVHERMLQILDEKIVSLQKEKASLAASRDTATKSTAGDKHETSRAMLQFELDNIKKQLAKTMRMRHDLKGFNPVKSSSKIEPGSLVFTASGIYYLSVGLGRLTVDNETIFAISPGSPLGSSLLNTKTDDFVINNKTIHINRFN